MAISGESSRPPTGKTNWPLTIEHASRTTRRGTAVGYQSTSEGTHDLAMEGLGIRSLSVQVVIWAARLRRRAEVPGHAGLGGWGRLSWSEE
jgi:hypothetical protein